MSDAPRAFARHAKAAAAVTVAGEPGSSKATVCTPASATLTDLDTFRRIRDDHLDPSRAPACSLVKVAGLSHPAFRVEIDALATLPSHA